jgi:carbonic anhydrase/acetyltransferase-like protein (isoleucine patch superfamily)
VKERKEERLRSYRTKKKTALLTAWIRLHVSGKALVSRTSRSKTTSSDEHGLDPTVVEQYKKILEDALSSFKSKEALSKLAKNTSAAASVYASIESLHSTQQQQVESFAALLAKKVAASVLPPSSVQPTAAAKTAAKQRSMSLTGLLSETEFEETRKSLPSADACKLWYTKWTAPSETSLHEFRHPSAVIIGDVSYGEHCSFFPHVAIRADVNSIRIGRCTNIQDNSVVHVSSVNPCVIGNNVTVGHHVCLHACTIEDSVLIGMGTIIMDGAIIRRHCILGAGTLVTPGQEFPEMSLIFGRPAKAVRTLTEEERHSIFKSAEKYVLLKELHMKALKESNKT